MFFTFKNAGARTHHGRVRRRSAMIAALGLATSAATSNSAAQGGPASSGTPAVGLTLEQVITSAMRNHPLIEAARARITASAGARRTAGALPNPFATYQVENAGFPGRRAPGGLDAEVSTFLTLPLEALYQRWPRVRRADEEVRAATADLAVARRQAALDATRAFHRVALAQVSLDVASDVHAGLERLASYNQSRVAEGFAAEGDLIRVQVELDRAGIEIVLQHVELDRARAELQPFLDGSPGAGLDSLRVALADTAEVGPMLRPLSALAKGAMQNRPDLLAARARAAADRAETSYQRMLTVRQLGATFGSKRINGENSMIAGVSLPLPLFDQNLGEVQRATGERVAADREVEWAERTVASEIQAAYEAAQRLSAEVSRLKGSFLSRAEEARRVTLAAYEEGAASLLQLLDATRTFGDARIAYSRVVFAQRQSLIELAAAAGEDPAAAITNRLAGDAVSQAAARRGGVR